MTGASAGALRGRGVVVTGGNRGIGLGLARGAVAAGASVAVWGRDPAANAAALAELGAAGAAVTACTCDVSDDAQVEAALAASIAALGPIHTVFANAGTSSAARRFHEQTDDEWRRVLAVNLGGTVHAFRRAIGHILDHGEGGALVAVSSAAARSVMRNYAPYAASKAAIEALVRNIAVEYARKGIRANAIVPGWVDTDMTADAGPAVRDAITARTPLGRFGTPEDFGAIAAFLGDPGLPFHTGQTVVVDGGHFTV